MKNEIPKPMRMILFAAGVTWIAAMWAKKDIAATLAAVPAEAAVPMIVTGLAITILKVALYTGVILLTKRLVENWEAERNEKQN